MGQDRITADHKDYQAHKVRFYNAFKSFFGAKGRKVDDEVLTGYWRALSHYDTDLLARALDNLATRDSAFMPVAGEVITEIQSLREQMSSGSSVSVYCPICNGTGIVLVSKMHDGTLYPTAYRCDCHNGGRIDKMIRPLSQPSVPDDAPEEKLPIATLIALEEARNDECWERGVEVSLICGECGKPFSVRIERKIFAGELKVTYLRRARIQQCEACHVEACRRKGLYA